jgi:hypothetical protein
MYNYYIVHRKSNIKWFIDKTVSSVGTKRKEDETERGRNGLGRNDHKT